jgi:hypothetical protein
MLEYSRAICSNFGMMMTSSSTSRRAAARSPASRSISTLFGDVGVIEGTQLKCPIGVGDGGGVLAKVWRERSEVGHAEPAKGDVAVIYQRFAGSPVYQPMHVAIDEGNGHLYQRNGMSSIEVVTRRFFGNYSNAIVRYVTPPPSR